MREQHRVRTAGHVPFPVDPLLNAKRLPKRVKFNVFGTFSRKMGSRIGPAPGRTPRPGFGFRKAWLCCRRRGFASEKLGFAPEKLGFASEKLRFAPEKLGCALEKLGFASEKLGFAPEKLGFASEKLGFALEKLGFASEKHGSCFRKATQKYLCPQNGFWP